MVQRIKEAQPSLPIEDEEPVCGVCGSTNDPTDGLCDNCADVLTTMEARLFRHGCELLAMQAFARDVISTETLKPLIRQRLVQGHRFRVLRAGLDRGDA